MKTVTMLEHEPFFAEVMLEEFERLCKIARYYEAFVICYHEFKHFFFHHDYYPYSHDKLPLNLSAVKQDKHVNMLMHKFFGHMK
jgi:hypothetical protein